MSLSLRHPDSEKARQQRPCSHNDWHDVRQRKGMKVLRCTVCQGTWRWPRGMKRGECGLERCIRFLNGHCPFEGSECPLLHIRRSKLKPVNAFNSRSGSAPSTPRGTRSPCPTLREGDGMKWVQAEPRMTCPPTASLIPVSDSTFGEEQAREVLGVIPPVRGVYWDVLSGACNTRSLAVRSRTAREGAVFLGSFRTFEACRLAAEEKGCFAFSWHSYASHHVAWRKQGFGLLRPYPPGTTVHDPSPVPMEGAVFARLVVDTNYCARRVGVFSAADLHPEAEVIPDSPCSTPEGSVGPSESSEERIGA